MLILETKNKMNKKLAIREICPELKIKAREEVNEVDHRIPEDIFTLRSWIEKQPHLKARTNDQLLLAFLRGCKYSMEKAKQKIDSYYTVRSLSPELFLQKQIDDKLLKLAKFGPFIPLPNPQGLDGPRIHITRYGHIPNNAFNVIELFKAQLRVLDIQLHEDDNVFIGGLLNIIDLSSLSINHILQFDLVLVKKMAIFADKAAPFRVKGVHFVNIPKEALPILNVIQSFLPKKIKERMVLHKSMESLYEQIPKHYLPIEYGGDNGTLQDAVDEWEKLFIRYKEYFDEDLQYKSNENLRIGKKICSESLFGLEGSFRKLEVD